MSATDIHYKDLRDFAEDSDPYESLKNQGVINADPFGLRTRSSPPEAAT